MDLAEFLQNILLNLADYRENSSLFPTSEDFSFIDYCLGNFRHSKAQLFQDLFVLYHLREKTGGFFVEFGATNGIDLSNTWQLEKRFQWNGILAEPAKCWREALTRNRHCMIDTRCVWTKTGEQLEFNEVKTPEFSTIREFSGKDGHAETRVGGNLYHVSTISLNDLLIEHDAPKIIDYLSIDTEGSELSILTAFDFSRFDIRIITVEHNYTADRELIQALLAQKGYARVFENFSRWDDWYIRR
jgi:FkbM family methyltransferase